MKKQTLILALVSLFSSMTLAQVGGSFACAVTVARNMRAANVKLAEKVIVSRGGPTYFMGPLSLLLNGAPTLLEGSSDVSGCDLNSRQPGTYACGSVYALSKPQPQTKASGVIRATPTSYFLEVKKQVKVVAQEVLPCQDFSTVGYQSRAPSDQSAILLACLRNAVRSTLPVTEIISVSARLRDAATGAYVDLKCQ